MTKYEEVCEYRTCGNIVPRENIVTNDGRREKNKARFETSNS
jgi:hypothetical protein